MNVRTHAIGRRDVIVRPASVLIDAETAALLAPAAGELVRAARARGPVPAALLAAAEELDQVRRALLAASGNPVADGSPGEPALLHDGRMTIPVASERYGIPERTLRHRCAQGRLGRREAGRWVIYPSELEAL